MTYYISTSDKNSQNTFIDRMFEISSTKRGS